MEPRAPRRRPARLSVRFQRAPRRSSRRSWSSRRAPGLEGLAQAVAALAERWEVVSLGRRAAEGTEDLASLSRLITGESGPLPLLPGRFDAAVVHGDVGADEIRHVAATLRQAGRLAIVSPGPAAGEALREAGLGVLAADARVIVAARRPGPAS